MRNEVFGSIVSPAFYSLCALGRFVASLSLNVLFWEMELRLSVLMKRNSLKRILGTYMEPSICGIQFIPWNQG